MSVFRILDPKAPPDFPQNAVGSIGSNPVARTGTAFPAGLLSDHAPVALALLDKELRYLQVNRLWKKEFFLERIPVIGKRHDEVFPDLHPGWRQVYARCLEGQAEAAETAPPGKDGDSPVQCPWEVRPWRGEDGQIGGLVLSCSPLAKEPAARPSRPGLTVVPAVRVSPLGIIEEITPPAEEHAGMPVLLGQTPFQQAFLAEGEPGLLWIEHPLPHGEGSWRIALPQAQWPASLSREATLKETAVHTSQTSSEEEEKSAANPSLKEERNGEDGAFFHIAALLPSLCLARFFLLDETGAGHEITRADPSGSAGRFEDWFPAEPLLWADMLAASEEAGTVCERCVERREDAAPGPGGLSAGDSFWRLRLARTGRKGQCLLMAEDMTHEHRAERARQNAQSALERQQLVVESLPVGVLVTDGEGKIQSLNRAAEQLLGQHQAAVSQGQPFTELLRTEKGEPVLPAEVTRVLDEKGLWKGSRKFLPGSEVEIEVRRMDDSTLIEHGLVVILRPRGLPASPEATLACDDSSIPPWAEERSHRQEILQLEEEVALARVYGQEAHHRIKNQLQLISSLLHLQVLSTASEEIRQALTSSQARLRSVATIHSQLYHSAATENLIRVQPYLSDLLQGISHAAGLDQTGSLIHLKISLAEAALAEPIALNLGLIVSELVTSALAHAFSPDERGEIAIDFSIDSTHGWLVVENDGKAAHEPQAGLEQGHLGFFILEMLGKQLGGHLSLSARTPHGTRVSLMFPHFIPPATKNSTKIASEKAEYVLLTPPQEAF